MKYARRVLAGCYILIPVFLFLSLYGCGRGYYRRDNRGHGREYSHYYRDGRWHQRDSLGHEIAVAGLAIGAFIDALPPSHETVVVGNTPYYHDDRYYYKQHSHGGYVVVPAPAKVRSQPKSDHNDRGERSGNRQNEGNRGVFH